MLQSTKNKQTLDILRKLRQKGAPQTEPISVPLDMTLASAEEVPLEEEAAPEEDFEGISEPISITGPNLKPRRKKRPSAT